ncbi:hypothetical protein HOV00_gp53 [Microbacterium phage Schubert]|uniref:Uncharacterized protein n=1 Tax=Microbacterium phage Schubert TaxID=2500787 RepID=A0A3T0INS6_9CAUD|nr:hypothetical protein HOV00_gp53 [Microbacterium phage Schubert]AZV01746.1 hypothetical protein SEA_SCHUBERT_40 [Microbacterium phage Schubert]
MDVDKEIKAANRRVQLGIERNYLIAMARLEGMTPEEYAAKVDRERAEEALVQTQQAAQEFGRLIGLLARSYQEFVENVATGFRQAFGR